MTNSGDQALGRDGAVSFAPRRDLRVAIEQSRRDVAAWYRTRGDGGASMWTEWAGERLPDMTRNRETTLELLSESNPHLRLAAVALVAEYWPPWGGFAAATLRLAFEDAESPIRGAALVALVLLRDHISDSTGHLAAILAELFPLSEADAERANRTAENIAAFIKAKVDNISGRLAGAFLPAMLESRASTESFLNHRDPQLRCAAIFVLKRHWGSTPGFARTCERLLFSDPSLKVRPQALAAISGYYLHTDDHRIGEMVATMVYDDSSPMDLRRDAYQTLFSIRGMPTAALLKAASPAFRFPEDVDWTFVDSFLRARQKRDITDYDKPQ